MSGLTRQDVRVLSEHITIGARHYVLERQPGISSGAVVAYEANRGGHVEKRLEVVSVSLPSFELCIDALLAKINGGAL